MFFVVRSNDSFNFALGWIKHIVILLLLLSPTDQSSRMFPRRKAKRNGADCFPWKRRPRLRSPRRKATTDARDWCARDVWYRPVSMRRMVQTCVRRTEGTDLCPWDGWCRPVSVRRKARTGGRGCPRDWDFRDRRPRRTCLSLKTYTDGADGCTSCINCDVVQWPSGPADRKIQTSIFQCNFGA